MDLKRKLFGLVRVVLDEAAQNPAFRKQLETTLRDDRGSAARAPQPITEEKRRGGRRAPAVLDPVEKARVGESELRSELAKLDLERLRDIIAQFGMDPGKLAMKWKDPNRIIDRIVEVAMARATKGDAFRAK
jgi:hypothetical protein